MKLDRIEYDSTPDLKRCSKPFHKSHWLLLNDVNTVFYFDTHIVEMRLKKEWITDKRSGSSAVDRFVPKDGSTPYNLLIFLHDALYSGHAPRLLADNMLNAGLHLGGVNEPVKTIAYKAVRAFGWAGYYKLNQPLKAPYQNNRKHEQITIKEIPCH